MKQDKDHIKDIFSSKLQGFEADLPPLMWDKIQADLPVNVSMQKTIRKSIYRPLSWVAAAAAIVVAVLYIMPSGNNENTSIAKSVDDKINVKRHSLAQFINKGEKENASASEINSQPSQGLLASSASSVNSVKPNVISASNNVLVSTPAVEQEVKQNEENRYVAEVNEQTDFEPKDAAFERDLKAKIAAFEASGQQSQNLFAENDTPIKSIKEKGRSKGLAIGVEGGGGFSKANDVANSSRYANASVGGAGLMTLRSQQYKLEHNQPISFGVAVNKKITDRLSIESGIVYTYVSAKIKLEGKPEYNQDDEQSFHYLGIPLSVNYKFAQWQKAEFYASLGGVIQKDFYGKIKSTSSIDDLLNTERTSSRDISQSRPQFSATGLLGASYPLYNKLSVYTSFGGAYYFNAKNEYETIFSDKKWLFNFNLGLKFGF